MDKINNDLLNRILEERPLFDEPARDKRARYEITISHKDGTRLASDEIYAEGVLDLANLLKATLTHGIYYRTPGSVGATYEWFYDFVVNRRVTVSKDDVVLFEQSLRSFYEHDDLEDAYDDTYPLAPGKITEKEAEAARIFALFFG